MESVTITKEVLEDAFAEATAKVSRIKELDIDHTLRLCLDSYFILEELTKILFKATDELVRS